VRFTLKTESCDSVGDYCSVYDVRIKTSKLFSEAVTQRSAHKCDVMTGLTRLLKVRHARVQTRELDVTRCTRENNLVNATVVFATLALTVFNRNLKL
jgi:hypothetical protein